MNAPHPLTGRNARAHGDEGERMYTDAEQAYILGRRDDLIKEKLADESRVVSILEGMDNGEINRFIARALTFLDRACEGDRISANAVLVAMVRIQNLVKTEGRKVLLEECELEAAAELDG